jgi:hypothetical protein
MSDDDDSHSSVRSLGDVAEAEEEELVIPHAASSSDSEDSASAVPTSIKTVWETKKFEKMVDKDGRKMWKCHFCGIERSEWNHTKAWHHAIGGKEVANCKSIPPRWKVVFARFAAQKETKKAERVAHDRNLAVSALEKEAVAYDEYSKQKDAKLAARNPRKTAAAWDLTPTIDDHSTVSSFSQPTSLKRSPFDQFFQVNSSKKSKHQSLLVTSSGKNNPAAERKLSLAINHLCVAHALPFSLPESPLFQNMLIHARNTNNSYKPPSRYEMSGDLLNANFVAYQRDQMMKLLMNVNVFGLGIYGDGATIVKVPLMNILACSAGNPSCVLDVVDCTDHVSEGNKKDAFFICQQMLPLMRQIDPEKKLFDLIAFDGAANVQKAGALIQQHFPMCTVIVGIEHTVSLLFGKVMAVRPMQEMCQFAKLVSNIVCLLTLSNVSINCYFISLLLQLRNVFGSTRHAPHAVFKKISKVHNNGRILQFIEPSECRMGGEALQLLRILRLKDTIMESVMSKVFIECKKFHFIGQIVKHDGFWDLLLAICQLWYPLFRLLRLADMRGGIDKVKYYVCQVDLLMESGLQNVMKKWSAPTCPADKLLSASMRKLDNRKDGNLKTEGLERNGDIGNGKLVYIC